MDNYQIMARAEPTNDYEKTEQDIIQAMISIRKLSQQQRSLAEELVGAANVAAFLNISRQVFGMG